MAGRGGRKYLCNHVDQSIDQEREIENGGGRERKEKRKRDFHKHSSINIHVSALINYIYYQPTHSTSILLFLRSTTMSRSVRE